MKNTLTFILLTLIFLCSCNKPKQKTTDNTPISDYYSSDYIAFQGKDNFEVINIDSLSNFSDLSITIDEMNCDNKIPGLTFSLDKSQYNFVGCSDCKKAKLKSCKGASSFIFIENDSIIRDLATKKKIHISDLHKVLNEINNGEYKYRTGKSSDFPIILNLNVDNKLPISMTKNVLSIIIGEFEQIHQSYKILKYNYEIHFEPYEVL
ncbi:hypothetical protein APR41_10755 [Salegentibacter salinarum]|uniref:Lipoprotein n=1 Tax=Salegentibacter salinarum TaxID=447422 RepID=A0A2N0TM04_9FLAO|nr:hypothetical protein [Salegentibacter salinarum]PKD15770.1 hypothetical protein APR41_10755 [Salegentibacter salinarum]SKB74234.1 hypothetical protein SAMN05660903_02358 [Salegentibacter salinarum]